MSEDRRNIILGGFMATGKSSVGRRLAIVLGYDFLDLDTLIAAEEGMPISRIFATRGEAAFRALETRMVERVAGRTGCVVATGGGTIVNARNLPASRLADPDAEILKLKDRKLLVVCKSGQTATAAAHSLRKMGATEVAVLKGGMVQWRSEQFPVTTK